MKRCSVFVVLRISFSFMDVNEICAEVFCLISTGNGFFIFFSKGKLLHM